MYIIKSIFPIKKAGGNPGNRGNPSNQQPYSVTQISHCATLQQLANRNILLNLVYYPPYA